MENLNDFEKLITDHQEKLLSARKAARIQNGITEELTGDLLNREIVESLGEVYEKLELNQQHIGKMILALFWLLRRKNLLQYAEASSVTDWLSLRPNGYGTAENRQLARVVDQIFWWVWQKQINEEPLTDPETGEEITVEKLFNGKNIAKLKESISQFEKFDEKQRQELVIAIATKSTQEAKAVRNKLEEKATIEKAPELAIRAVFRPDPKNPDINEYVIRVNREQDKLFQRLLGTALKVQFETGI